MGLPLISSILILIVFARLFGQLSIKLKQPSVLGELFAGILLGPSLLGWIEPSDALKGVTEIAVFLIILQAGLEIDAKDILNSMKGRGFLLACLGFFIPFFSGYFIGYIYDFTTLKTLILSICISITALPVALRILEQFKILDTDIAKYALSTAILNDIVALLILGIILSLPENISTIDVLQAIAVKSIKLGFLAASILFMYSFIRKLDERGVKVYKYLEKLEQYFGSEALFAFMIIFVLIFSSLSELLGFHAIIGAFFGALLIDRKLFQPEKFHQINQNLNIVSNGFLAPIFFTALGLQFQVQSLNSFGFISIVILVAVVSKIFSGYVGGRIIGLPHRDSMGLGAILNGRGVMELVVASIAYQKGLIGPTIFSTLMLMGMITTFITPPVFQYVYNRKS